MFVTIIGIVFMIFGVFLIIKSEWVLENFGRVEWAEVNLGGGSRIFYKILGIIAIFVGLLLIFNFFGDIVLYIFKPVFLPGGN